MKEVNNHWSDNLIPSPSKKDITFQHVKALDYTPMFSNQMV